MNASMNAEYGVDSEHPTDTYAPPRSLLPPFYEDQGALLVNQHDASTPADVVIAAVLAAGERDLHVPASTAAALAEAGAAIDGLSARERGRALSALVMADNVGATVELAVRSGVLGRLLPDLDRLREMPRGDGRYKNVYIHTLRVLSATPPDLITRLAALLHDIAKPDTLVIEGGNAHFPNHDLLGAERAMRRLRSLKFDREVVDAVATLVRLHLRANSYEPDWTDSAVRRLHADAGDHWHRLLDLSYADVTSARPEAIARARRRVEELGAHAHALDVPVEVSPLDGDALMQHFQRGPGRWIGDLKRHLLELVHDGTLVTDDDAAAWSAAEAFVADNDETGLPR